MSRRREQKNGLQIDQRDQLVHDCFRAYIAYASKDPCAWPRYIGYSDTFLGRAQQALKKNEVVPIVIQEHMQCDLLYFVLLQEMIPQVYVPSNRGAADLQRAKNKRCSMAVPTFRSSVLTRFSVENLADDEPLWSVLDDVVSKEVQATRAWSQIDDGRKARRVEGEDECSREFWEHYRASSAKTTDAQVANVRAACGGRIATKGWLPTVETRIMQEFESMSARARPPTLRGCSDPEPGSPGAPQRRGSRDVVLMEPPTSSKSIKPEPSEHLSSWGFAVDQTAGQIGLSKSPASSRGFQGMSKIGTPQHTLNRAQSRSREPSRESQSSFSSKIANLSAQRWRRKGTVKSEHTKDDSVGVKLPQIVPPLSLPLTTKFISWDDYKIRKSALDSDRLDANAKNMLRTAITGPQNLASVAHLEHRAAVEWRVTNSLTGQHVGNKLPCYDGALSARSRKVHLPEIVKQRSPHNGSLSDRSHLRVPVASFRRPWSREERHLWWNVKKVRYAGCDQKQSAIQCYARMCRNTGLQPQAASIRFLINMPSKLSLRHESFSDDDLLAVTAALPRDGSIEIATFDAGENHRLTDTSICSLLHALTLGVTGPLRELQLDHCIRLSKDTILLCTKLLMQRAVETSSSLCELQVLDLSGITIPHQEYVGFAQAVQQHRRLRDLRLAETSLGRYDKAHASRVIGMLVEAEQLQALDLAWNMLDAAAFQVLGKGLVEHQQLVSLGLANAGASWDEVLGGSPVLAFLEHLSSDQTLTNLDLSSNTLNEGAGLVLEYACRRHPNMCHIDLSSNPLGLNGKRSLLRLLACEECPKLTELVLNDCFLVALDSQLHGPFDGDPSGRYCMNLEQPIQRALLRLLLMRCAEGPEGIPLQKLMRNVTYRSGGTEGPFNFKNIQFTDNVWKVPSSGELSFELSANEIVIGNESTLATEMHIQSRIEQMVRRPRLILSGGVKTVAVLSQVKRAFEETEMSTLLHAISRDFILTPEQVQGLCVTKVKRALCGQDPALVLCLLLPCFEGIDDIRESSFCTRSLHELHRVHTGGRPLLDLNLENPTGHYELLLSEPSHHGTAQRLLLLNRWELHVWKAAGRVDVSQYGNGKNFRNATIEGRVWNLTLEEWRLPFEEHLKFDYTSLRRPPEGAVPITDEVAQSFLRNLRNTRREDGVELLKNQIAAPDNDLRKAVVGDYMSPSLRQSVFTSQKTRTRTSLRGSTTSASLGFQMGHQTSKRDSCSESLYASDSMHSSREIDLEASAAGCISDHNIISVLWSLSSHMWLLCRQLRELLCIFTRPESKSEVLAVLFARTIDWPLNANLCHSKLDNPTWKILQQKIGYVNSFSFFQPENYHDSLDLSVNEQKRVAHLLISLWVGEHPDNLRNPRIDWMGPRLVQEWDNFANGLPHKWATWDELPDQGLLEATYTCSQDNMKLKLRRRLASTIGGYMALPESEAELASVLKFWTVLGSVPEDVHHFLYFMVCNFKSLAQAFKEIDINGDGELSLKEFVSGCQRLGFRLPCDIGTYNGSATKDERRTSANKEPTAPTSPKSPTKRSLTKKMTSALEEAETEKVAANLTAVYRFLDPNHDGSVSAREFFALEGMWRELKQAMWEFIEHLRSLYGSLEAAWDSADIDMSGTIDSQEFESLAKQWEFDGPVAQVYMWIDQDGGNSITKDEWLMLEHFSKPTW